MSEKPVITEEGRPTQMSYSTNDGGSIGHEDVYTKNDLGQTEETNLHFDPETGKLHEKQ